jgi:hypothetical protein
MIGSRLLAPIVGVRCAVPMAGVHVRRVFDEWCRTV